MTTEKEKLNLILETLYFIINNKQPKNPEEDNERNKILDKIYKGYKK